MSPSRIVTILFVDTRNSARSILAEALLNRLGAGRFEGCSAGFDPAADISPYALSLLHRFNYNTGWLATKPVEAMIGKYAPAFDLVVRLSPGAPMDGRWPRSRHAGLVDWRLDDPREMHMNKALIARAYEALFDVLTTRIDAVTRLSAEAFDDPAICQRLDGLPDLTARLAS